ncbi:MAG: efflux RND transporter periplasmic adaptor subunit [Candidatus Omnitrophica bacterium]|nr:efflux RND transporter periplasmic adaptor subunit [Candidatus Omnitrophota bacterium]
MMMQLSKMQKIPKNIKIVVIVAAVAAIAVSSYLYGVVRSSLNHKLLKVSGTIEGDDVRISFRVQGQIIELLTDEGRVIKEGEVVARLNTDELSKIKANTEAALKAAEYQLSLDTLDYERAENLWKAGSVSTQKRDEARTKYDASRAKVEELKANLELSETRLGFAELAAPLNGYVLVKSALAGEVVQIGAPVFTAIDLNNIWVTAYINETDLARVKLGQKAYVVTDTYPDKKYDAWVSFVSSQAEFTPKFIQTTTERVKLVYRIKVRVDNASLELKPGMPADAYIIS